MKRRRVAKDQEQDANDENEDDNESLIEEESGYLEHKARTKEVADVISEIRLTQYYLMNTVFTIILTTTR